MGRKLALGAIPDDAVTSNIRAAVQQMTASPARVRGLRNEALKLQN
jgi:hypothetical protein